jgi:hypothetical protein
MTIPAPSSPDSDIDLAALERAGAALAARADALATFAADCDRWGLGPEAREALALARRDRVASMISHAQLYARRHAGRADPSWN